MWLNVILQIIKNFHSQKCIPEIHILVVWKIVMLSSLLKMVMLMYVTLL